MKLEHIGFSTMYDKRVRELSGSSEMKRCELILTDLCTFRCPYCHGIREECRGNIPMEKARMIIDIWTENGLENLRFSGGEPTIWPGLPELVRYSKEKGAGNWHFPCTIYMREMGAPIGEVSGSMRHERILWAEQHDTHKDPICRKYCLDATRDFNNRYMYYKIREQTVIPVLDPQDFPEELFAEDGLIRIGAGDLCFDNAKDHRELFLARDEGAEYRLLGCCMTEDMPQCDNAENRVALMYEDNDAKRFWFVIRASEFMEMLEFTE